MNQINRFTLLACAMLLGACAVTKPYSQAQLPSEVRAPEGHKVAWESVATGELTYQCRAKAQTTDQFEWVFVGPKALLKDRSGKEVGQYFGPPATWKVSDGSEVSGAQVAVAPAGSGNIPSQLVKANPAKGGNYFNGVSFVQRVNTKGGVAPVEPCNAAMLSATKVVPYQADYIFYRPN
jgi:Protein of unknown function (DUF3455)